MTTNRAQGMSDFMQDGIPDFLDRIQLDEMAGNGNDLFLIRAVTEAAFAPPELEPPTLLVQVVLTKQIFRQSGTLGFCHAPILSGLVEIVN
jgi:hypothetical protein